MPKYFEPIRPLAAPDNGAAYCSAVILSNVFRVDYGQSDWPSRSYWLVGQEQFEADLENLNKAMQDTLRLSDGRKAYHM